QLLSIAMFRAAGDRHASVAALRRESEAPRLVTLALPGARDATTSWAYDAGRVGVLTLLAEAGETRLGYFAAFQVDASLATAPWFSVAPEGPACDALDRREGLRFQRALNVEPLVRIDDGGRVATLATEAELRYLREGRQCIAGWFAASRGHAITAVIGADPAASWELKELPGASVAYRPLRCELTTPLPPPPAPGGGP
ncbi:MAG: hypothetical protein KC731_27370, partial [Myxococcales bacterium]|nr:hypothetical protein [Myxococcales bacterium]